VQRTTGGCVRQDKRLARRLAETTGGDDFVSSMFLKERPRRTPNAAVRCSAVDAAARAHRVSMHAQRVSAA
jgi:hypothetical protein